MHTLVPPHVALKLANRTLKFTIMKNEQLTIKLIFDYDISADIESEIRLFADDYICYREIKTEEDKLKLQRDIDRLGSWSRKWGMRFQPV